VTSIPPYHNPVMRSGEWKWWITDAGRITLRQSTANGLLPEVDRYINTQTITATKSGDVLICTNFFAGYVKKNGAALVSIAATKKMFPAATGNFLAYVAKLEVGDVISLSSAPEVNTIIEVTWMAYTNAGETEQRIQLPPPPEYENSDPRWYGYWIDCFKKTRQLAQSDMVHEYTDVQIDEQTYAALALVDGVAEDVADVTVTTAGKVAIIVSIHLDGNANADVDFDVHNGTSVVETITIPSNGSEPLADMAFRAYDTNTGSKTYTLKATADGADVGGYLKVKLMVAV
jgi:hypothetical protein